MIMPDNLRIVGVTGTRNGMTGAQRRRALELIHGIHQWSTTTPELHHGDCVGADAELNVMARSLWYRTVSHPPTADAYRAHSESDETWEPKHYLVRNDDIVTASLIVLAFPKEMSEQRYGGTWWTVRQARKLGKRLVIVWPDGTETS
jgi:hypothetical protein